MLFMTIVYNPNVRLCHNKITLEVFAIFFHKFILFIKLAIYHTLNDASYIASDHISLECIGP